MPVAAIVAIAILTGAAIILLAIGLLVNELRLYSDRHQAHRNLDDVAARRQEREAAVVLFPRERVQGVQRRPPAC